jgi:methylsterol monooxygenase
MSLLSNSTAFTAPESYLGIYNELSKYNVHLNIFERLWAVCQQISPLLGTLDL